MGVCVCVWEGGGGSDARAETAVYSVIPKLLTQRWLLNARMAAVCFGWQGQLHNNTAGKPWAATGMWSGAATNTGTWWCPSAVYSAARKKMILWWTNAPGKCCDAFWGVAESSDGIHFELVSMNETGANHLNTSVARRQLQDVHGLSSNNLGLCKHALHEHPMALI